jgi:cytochrome c553
MKLRLRSVACVALLMPVLAWAASKARQEYLEAVRLEPNLEHGAELFETCAICHGPKGAGTTNGDVPRIAGQHFKVLVKQLVDFRHQRRWDIRMERFTETHLIEGPQDIADVAAYVSQLDRPEAHGAGPGELVERGAALYAARCQSCHLEEGAGDEDKLVPRIGGQHYEYLIRQMHDAVDGRRPNFSRSHIRLLARLDYQELMAVADYLSRAGWEPGNARQQ